MKDYTLSTDALLGSSTITAVSQSAIKSYVDASVSVKANKTYVDASLNLKTDKTTTDEISAKIPAEATSSNKLTDKEYVDSSVLSIKSKIGVAGGIATLDSNAKIPTNQLPDQILGQMLLGGSFDGSGVATISANLQKKLGISDATIQLINSATDDTSANPKEYGYKTLEGVYFLADAEFTIGGVTFEVGDWLVGFGTKWSKIDNTDAVISVAGRTGTITLTKNDVGLDKIVNTGDSASPAEGGTDKFTTGGAYTELAKKEDITNKSITVNSSSTDAQYPSAKAVYSAIMDASMSIRSKTYSELASMKTAGTLNPGQIYRITDFVTTCNPTGGVSNVIMQSARHAFDLIVIATSTNTFGEDAMAVLHSGDTYFANSKIDGWQIRYCFDNDAARFTWVDTTSGKGVIYYMKDSWGNEAPYDFKNIQFKRKWNSTTSLHSDLGTASEGIFCYTFTNVLAESSAQSDVIDNSLVYTGDEVACNRMDLRSAPPLTGPTNNVFFGPSYFNILEYNCCSNTFGNQCCYNKLSQRCFSNVFKDNCGGCSLGIYCSSNIIETNGTVYGPYNEYCFIP